MGGCFYDFHENKFLAVIILWCMYFLETGHFKSMLASAALLLMVKEDAPVYAACIGLYQMCIRDRVTPAYGSHWTTFSMNTLEEPALVSLTRSGAS